MEALGSPAVAMKIHRAQDRITRQKRDGSAIPLVKGKHNAPEGRSIIDRQEYELVT
jgi:hypothetical protein